MRFFHRKKNDEGPIQNAPGVSRRDFVRLSTLSAGAVAALPVLGKASPAEATPPRKPPARSVTWHTHPHGLVMTTGISLVSTRSYDLTKGVRVDMDRQIDLLR